jgi:L-rhamnose isomerase / sugar isomerase
LVDKVALAGAQSSNDTVLAQEILQQAFRTDVRPIVAEARLRLDGALNPVSAFRMIKVREELIKQRGSKTVATGL